MKEEYDDLIGCIVQSLNDGFADYCFTSIQVNKVKTRLLREGKTSMLAIKITDDDFTYWHLLPIQIYKQIEEKKKWKDLKLRHMTVKPTTANYPFKYVYEKEDEKIVLKEYGGLIKQDVLAKLIIRTNEENM